MVYKPFMEAFLAEIANVTAPAPALAWTSRILDVLPRQHLDLGAARNSACSGANNLTFNSISKPISDPIVKHRSPRPGGAAAAAPEPEPECVCIEP